jgi:hypothetical protein
LPLYEGKICSDLRQQYQKGRKIMAWNLLLTSDIGLLSLFTILFMIVMAAFILRYVMRHVAEESKNSVATNKLPNAH